MAEKNRGLTGAKWPETLNSNLQKHGLRLLEYGEGQTVFPCVDFYSQSYRTAIIFYVLGADMLALGVEVPSDAAPADDIAEIIAKSFPQLAKKIDPSGVLPYAYKIADIYRWFVNGKDAQDVSRANLHP